MDEQKAVEYLDGLKKRAFMTMNEVDLANLVIKYKKQINKANECLKELLEMSKDYEMVNLIDRLENILFILEGKEVK